MIGMSFKEHGEEFHKLANKKIMLFDTKYNDLLIELINEYALGEKLDIFIPLFLL